MISCYGYKNGSGEYFITIDADKCDGCGDCVRDCPAKVFELAGGGPKGSIREKPVAEVREALWERLDKACTPCKSGRGLHTPCVALCPQQALHHSW